MERAFEGDDALALRVQPRELDRVLDGLRAGVEEGSALLAADRDERAEPLGELHVALVGDDGEVGVEEALDLLADRFEHPRMVVADVRDADSSDEVDERVAVDVRDRRSARAVGDDRLVDDQRVRDRLQLSLEDLAAPRAGNLRAYLDHAGGRHAREPRWKHPPERSSHENPIAQLQAWLDEARAVVGGPHVMTLATATPEGKPSARVVLLRGLDERGLTFFTNRASRKGDELSANPRAAVAMHWWELGRQVRVEGGVEEIAAEESTAYWATRPRGSQLAAWASPQSQPLGTVPSSTHASPRSRSDSRVRTSRFRPSGAATA